MSKVTKDALVRDAWGPGAGERIPLEDCKTIAELFMEIIVREAYTNGRQVEIRGFGTFYSKLRKPRPARNPRTGEPVWIPVFRKMLFRFGIDLSNAIKEGHA